MNETNTTTRTFPRTLAEAFPDSREASVAKAHYGAAIQVHTESPIDWDSFWSVAGLAFVLGMMFGMWIK